MASPVALSFVSDAEVGLRRVRRRGRFVYLAADGTRVRDEATLARISSLAIPPAWERVWICPEADGHLQATGRDAKGRKQYRYQVMWRAERDEAKFERLPVFGTRLPGLRARTDEILATDGDLTERERMLALVVALLDTTLLRVGNETYAAENDSYGLTTLRKAHASVGRGHARFAFRGKSGREHAVAVDDPRLARAIRACMHLPGQHLFRYRRDDGGWSDVTSTDVNAFLAEAMGGDATAKDFRTWGATVEAVRSLAPVRAADERDAAKAVVAAADAVAGKLGNTRAVARSSYIDPRVVDAFGTGDLAEAWRRARPRRHLDRAESATLHVLDRA